MGRVGREEPRVYTPPLRPLTPETTYGYSVIEFATEVLDIALMPWQRWLLLHMLETRPNGNLRFRTVVVLMARQNGKSTLAQVISLWFLYVYGAHLVIGTAQDLDVAEDLWQEAVDMVEATPELDALKGHVVRVNGKKSLNLVTGERYKVKAANRRAGRGLSGDLVLLDELREHQSWEAWGAVSKTTMARERALILALSNAGDATSVVLHYLRKLGHLTVGDPDGINADDDTEVSEEVPEEDLELEDDDTLGIFEWSAPPGTGLHDRDAWAAANPALGYTIDERTIAAAARTDPEWIFRTEVLCQWAEGSRLEGPFPEGAWEACADKESRRAPGAPIALCVDVSWDRSHSYIGLASTREDGRYHVEVIARRAGTDWLVPWFTSPERPEEVRQAPVAMQARGAPVASLIKELTAAGVRVVEWGGASLGAATGAFYDRVRAEVGEGTASVSLRHRDQPLLNIAAATASTRPMGDAWLWDRRRSVADAAPLIAVTGALWCLIYEKPRKSAYASRRLEVF